MAHFAELDETGTVTRVIVVNNSDILDENGQESEAVGIAFCQQLFGADTQWVQTSYNGNFRKRYAGVGFSFDAERDAFIEPQPFASWTLNEETCDWDPPTPYPNDGQAYQWDEEQLAWVSREQLQLVRARNADGTFMADDPATPDVNEAWTDGSAS